MALRIVHTADLHLGHTLHGIDRSFEHAAFLDWLIELLEREGAHALLVAGDVFDAANPPANSIAAWYRFLARAWRQMPALQVVVVGGNHDSAARLDAPHPLLTELGRLHVLGAVPRTGKDLDFDRLIVPLKGSEEKIEAWAVAMPFIRGIDLPAIDDASDPLVAGVMQIYSQAFEAARARREGKQALIALGHCYMVGGNISELSERKLFGGNLHALPAEMFPADVAYVALGHLHRPQLVGKREHVRYSGSVIPLSFEERAYPQQVQVVDVLKGEVSKVGEIRVPRFVELIRIPDAGGKSLSEVVALLQALPEASSLPVEQRPMLEVQVELTAPEPHLRATLDGAVKSKDARLVRIAPPIYTGTGKALAEVKQGASLAELDPETVFTEQWKHYFKSEALLEEYLVAFRELVHAADEAGERAP